MKRINILLSLIASLLFFISCNEDYVWDEEQYEQYISFKAPMNDQGCTNIYIRYKPEGKVTYKLPIIVSGSTMNEKTRHIHIAEDQDTLVTINEQRFGPNRPEWWYEPLEKDKYYTFNEEFIMNAGVSLDSMDIDFTLGGIDMTRKWVVPLTIVDDPSFDYKKHPRKNYAKAILRVWPFNDYSGKYSTSTMEVYFRNPDTGDIKDNQPMVTDQRTAYVVDENTIFFYAGLMNEEMKVEDRQKYKVYIRFLGHGSDNDADKKLEIWSDNEDINFKLKTQNPMYMTAAIPDVTKPYLEHRYVSFDIEYDFDDITSVKYSEGNVVPVYYKVKGTLILERNVNTQIPDEDQAIQW